MALQLEALFAQSVGIGTVTPNANIAILHIEVPDKINSPQGLLLPKLSNVQIQNIPVNLGNIDHDGHLLTFIECCCNIACSGLFFRYIECFATKIINNPRSISMP